MSGWVGSLKGSVVPHRFEGMCVPSVVDEDTRLLAMMCAGTSF
jgi:hypothetical protein